MNDAKLCYNKEKIKQEGIAVKARVAKEKELVLLYHFEQSERGNQIKEVLSQLGVEWRVILPEELGQTLGWCAGLHGFARRPDTETPTEIQEEMMVFQGLTSKRLEMLLAAFRQEKIAKVELKAVITGTNQSWTWRQLYEELCKERSAVG